MSAFEQGITAGLDAVRSVAGVEITITRGSASVTIDKATRANNFPSEVSEEETRFRSEDAAWIVRLTDLEGFGLPKKHDRVTCGPLNYQCGSPAWRWADDGRTHVRILTNLVK